MGGITIQKVVWLSFVVGSGAIFLNAAMDIEMLDFPEATKTLMVGDRLELEWKYNLEESARNQWKISLFVFNNTSMAKEKLMVLRKPGEKNIRSPLHPVYQRLYMELSYDRARMSLPSTTFEDTAGYGIIFEPTAGNSRVQPFPKVTDVTIVDMLLNEAESSTVQRTWIGQPVKFFCTIILKTGVDSPSFRWKNVVKNITLTENVYSTRSHSVLTVTPKDEEDFGTYKCYARTTSTKIKYNMTLLKIDYPGYPILLNFSPQKRTLSWMAPERDTRGSKSSFTVQYLQDRATCKWVNVNKTSALSLSIFSFSEYQTGRATNTCSVRVCFERKKKTKNVSCSREHKVYSEISPAPTIHLVNHSSKKATLSWKRQNDDRTAILGYVIQLFHSSKYQKQKVTSIHVDQKQEHGKYTFGTLETLKDVLLRVCVRNTLCIYEQSCSKKVGLQPLSPSQPRSIQIKFFKKRNISKANITWKEPLVTGKGSIFYTVEIQKDGKGEWKRQIFTKHLHAILTSPSLNDRIRVCAENHVDRKSSSCSKSYDLGKTKLKNLGVESGGCSFNQAKTIFLALTVAMATNIVIPMQ